MTDDEMLKALAAYHGPVTRCRPGHARGKRVKPLPVMRDKPVDVHHERKALKDDEAAQWLCEHDPEAIAAERRRTKREGDARLERAARAMGSECRRCGYWNLRYRRMCKRCGKRVRPSARQERAQVLLMPAPGSSVMLAVEAWQVAVYERLFAE